MNIMRTYTEFVSTDDQGKRAAFEAAMTKRIQEEGYKMSDLMFELFQCQEDIESLKNQVCNISAQLNPKELKKKKKDK